MPCWYTTQTPFKPKCNTRWTDSFSVQYPCIGPGLHSKHRPPHYQRTTQAASIAQSGLLLSIHPGPLPYTTVWRGDTYLLTKMKEPILVNDRKPLWTIEMNPPRGKVSCYVGRFYSLLWGTPDRLIWIPEVKEKQFTNIVFGLVSLKG